MVGGDGAGERDRLVGERVVGGAKEGILEVSAAAGIEVYRVRKC